MDVDLKPPHSIIRTPCFVVSILVIMDVDLKLDDDVYGGGQWECFNPCYNGC